MSRIAVYDRFWTTGGGGERYAAGIAEALQHDHEVTLIAHDVVDTSWLGERLGIDLSGTATEVVDDCIPSERWSSSFDLLVNASYRSRDPNGASRGLFVVHFPDDPVGELTGWQRGLVRGGRHLPRRAHSQIEVVEGFHGADVIRSREARWTNGRGVLHLDLAPGEDAVLELEVGRFLPSAEPRPLAIEVNGTIVAKVEVRPPTSRLGRLRPLRIKVPVHSAPGGVEVVLHSGTTVPADLLGNGDRRHLGVPVVGVTVSGPVIGRQRAWGSIAGMDRDAMAWLRTYDEVVVNSEFTRRWTQRLWGVDGAVLHPPVRLRPPGRDKERLIVSVGRFFAAERGHSKKQLEMVKAFRALCDAGVEGWHLELVGGCSSDDRPYLDAVRAEAAGLPVTLSVDVSGAVLDDLYRRASIYWHATGLGEDLDADPVRAEHFGITTVEAMSAGAVPVVGAGGGQVEVVADGVTGFTVSSFDDLATRTRQLIDAPDLRATMSRAAIERAEQFGVPAFERRLRSIVDRVLGGLPS